VVSIFLNRALLVRLAGALLFEEHDEWTVARRSMSERSIKLLRAPAGTAEIVATPKRTRERLRAAIALRGT